VARTASREEANMDKASDKAINRISKELQAKLDGQSATLPKVKVQDGKVTCPGCSRVAKMGKLAVGVDVVTVPATCTKCHTGFIIDASVPDGSPGPVGLPAGPPEPSMEHGSNPTYRLVSNKPGGHEHIVQMDDKGNGVSSRVEGHVHVVKDYKAQPGDGHTHEVARTKPNEAGNMDGKIRSYIKLEDLGRIGIKMPAIQDVGEIPLRAELDITDFLSNIELETYQELSDGKNRATFRAEFEVTW
jgi:hypothetical protein